jgi:TRAP-type transport system small permease protein
MIFRLVDRLLDSLLFAVLGAMGAIVAVNVFCRFVLSFSLYWGDEAAQALLVWLTFLGAAVAVRDRGHYSFDYLARISTGSRRLLVGVLSRVITIVALLALLYWSAEVAWGIRPWIMPAMEVSRVWVYAAGPVGCLLMLLYAARDLVRVIRARGAEEEQVAAV